MTIVLFVAADARAGRWLVPSGQFLQTFRVILSLPLFLPAPTLIGWSAAHLVRARIPVEIGSAAMTIQPATAGDTPRNWTAGSRTFRAARMDVWFVGGPR